MKDDGVIVSSVIGSIQSFFSSYRQPENETLPDACWRGACLFAGAAVSATAAIFLGSLIISAVTTLAARVIVGGLVGAGFGFVQHHYAQHMAERVRANNGQNGAAVTGAAAGNPGTPVVTRVTQQLPATV